MLVQVAFEISNILTDEEDQSMLHKKDSISKQGPAQSRILLSATSFSIHYQLFNLFSFFNLIQLHVCDVNLMYEFFSIVKGVATSVDFSGTSLSFHHKTMLSEMLRSSGRVL